MYLLFLDDSGKGHKTYTVVGGLAVHEQDVWGLSRAADEIVARIPSVPDDAEIHADSIRWGKKQWRGVEEAARQRILQEIAGLIATGYPGQIRKPVLFATALHVPSNTHHPVIERVHEETFSRCSGFLSRQAALGDRHRCVAILDQTGREEQHLQNQMRTWRSRGSTTGAKIGPMASYVEVPFFVDSRRSRLVQLADVVANTVFRFYLRGDSELFEALLPAFFTLDGTIHGLTHLVAGHRTCACPACGSR